jgi:hypothetical protein
MMLMPQQYEPSSSINMISTQAQARSKPQQQVPTQRTSYDSDHNYINRLSFDNTSLHPPIYTDFAPDCPFSPRFIDDIFSGTTHALDLTTYNQLQEFQISRSNSLHFSVRAGLEVDILDMAFGNGTGTMKPDLLDYNTGAKIQMDNAILGDHEL